MTKSKVKKKKSKVKSKKQPTKNDSPTKGLKRNTRYKSLDPVYAPRTRKELIDYDYVNQLSDDEKKWLAQFTDEWAGAAVEKNSVGNVKPGHLHRTNKLAKDCYDRNNRRNNDVLGVTKAVGLLSDINTYVDEKLDGWYITNSELTEDALLAHLDEKNSEDSILSLDEFLDLQGNLTSDVVSFYKQYYGLE